VDWLQAAEKRWNWQDLVSGKLPVRFLSEVEAVHFLTAQEKFRLPALRSLFAPANDNPKPDPAFADALNWLVLHYDRHQEKLAHGKVALICEQLSLKPEIASGKSLLNYLQLGIRFFLCFQTQDRNQIQNGLRHLSYELQRYPKDTRNWFEMQKDYYPTP